MTDAMRVHPVSDGATDDRELIDELGHDGVMVSLRIVVPEEFIMDGMASVPEVGDRVGYLLEFTETGPQANPHLSNNVVAAVEVWNEGRVSAAWVDPEGLTHAGTYSMLLTGDGWSAYFRSTHLYEGTTTLTGTFVADWPGVIPIDTETTGTVNSCELITRVSYPDSTGRHTQPAMDTLEPLRLGHAGFRSGLEPVEPIPAGESGWVSMAPPRNGPWIRDAGILVELEIDSRL
ncbi:hypothetical protein ACNHUS_09340 [Actinomycetes bacterium M1A6_2h]